MTMKKIGTAIITGASSGIGLAYAWRLAKRGYDLILVARKQPALEVIAEEIRDAHRLNVEILVADLATPEGCAATERLFGQRGEIEMLVNNAGMGAMGPVGDVDGATLLQLVNLNVVALTRLSHAALAAFRPRRHGTLINIGSIIAFRAAANAAAYSGSKAYVLNFTRSLQLENAGGDIRIQAVLPGPVRTAFFDAAGSDYSVFPEESYVSAEEVVDAALVGLDAGEEVSIPTLADSKEFKSYAALGERLRDLAGNKGIVAARYDNA
jgi:short-subunit dehydrogenase